MQRLGKLSDLARELNLSRQAVSKAAKAGKFTVFPGGKVDLDVAAAQYRKNTDPTQRERSLGQLPRADVPPPAQGSTGDSFTEARARREWADAQRSELELEKLRGTLGDREAMAREYANHVIAARQLLQAISARLAAQLAAESDPKRCGALIDAEVRRVCAELEASTAPTQ